MEQAPQNNSEEEYHRPYLDIDLSGPDGNVFNVISMARQHLTGHALASFNQTLWQWTEVGSGKKYDDILALVNDYMDLQDTSDTYPQYGRPAHIMAAVDALNGHLQLLPPGIECEVTGLYPELDDPDLGTDKYGILLEEEVQRVEYEIGKADERTRDDWLELRTQLLACVASLRRVGVEW